MAPRNAPARATAAVNPGREAERFGGRLGFPNSTRSPRRQRLVAHLYRCGPRPVFEALIAVEAGQELDVVLEDFCRLSPETYRAVGADVLPIDEVTLIDGGRA